MDLYNIFFNICLGLFIGGVIMSIISIILAGTTIQHQSLGHIDHTAYIDHIDHIDHLDHTLAHIEHVDHADHTPTHIEHVDHADFINQTEHIGHLGKEHLHKINHFKDSGNINGHKDITPAPFMLLFSEFLLVFGISGILYYFIIIEWPKWIIFFITPLTSFLFVELVSMLWKRIAINRHYETISSKNIIGTIGEVVLDVDSKGGIIKINSNTPMEFEKIHSKPLHPEKQFSKGQHVFIYAKKDGYFLIDNKIPLEEEIESCPNCGAIIVEENECYCVYCGAKLLQ